MSKIGYFAVFIVVAIVHAVILRSHIEKRSLPVTKSDKVYKITLSKVVVKKPKPPVIPPEPKIEQITLPNPKPFIEPKPIIKKIKKPKRKRVKRVKKEPEKIKEIEKIEETKKEVITQKEQILPKVEPIAQVADIDTSTIKDRYISKIREQIRKKLVYPKIAKRMHIEGEVEISFVVYKDGDISDIRVINSSRKILTNGALKTIKSLVLEPIPKDLRVDQLKLEVPIEFKLKKG